MKKLKSLFISAGLLMAFVIWTILISLVDVRNVGPLGSRVGFATVNEFFHDLTGVHIWLYNITDWLGLVPLAFVIGFGILGLLQWIKRKHILKVDKSILILGVFYIAVIFVYLLFEIYVVNYRPVLINGYLEASYPSSTTLLVLCVMPTAAAELNTRISNLIVRRCTVYIIIAFTVFMVMGRTISGVHWLTDIIGGALLSAGLVTAYMYARENN